MSSPGARTAVVVPVALPDPLERIRQVHVDNARLGVPAHVTLLFPFVPAAALEAAHIELAASVLARGPAFDAAFRKATSFDPTPSKEGVVWLAPEPAEPFVRLVEALSVAFPEYPPYEGIHDTVIPHLTLANADVDIPALVSAAGPELPFTRRIDAAALLVEDQAGSWRIERELPLA